MNAFARRSQFEQFKNSSLSTFPRSYETVYKRRISWQLKIFNSLPNNSSQAAFELEQTNTQFSFWSFLTISSIAATSTWVFPVPFVRIKFEINFYFLYYLKVLSYILCIYIYSYRITYPEDRPKYMALARCCIQQCWWLHSFVPHSDFWLFHHWKWFKCNE